MVGSGVDGAVALTVGSSESGDSVGVPRFPGDDDGGDSVRGKAEAVNAGAVLAPATVGGA
jgi:hypothetical protein